MLTFFLNPFLGIKYEGIGKKFVSLTVVKIGFTSEIKEK